MRSGPFGLSGHLVSRADASRTASDSSGDVSFDLFDEPADAARADLHAAGKLTSGFEAIDLAATEADTMSSKLSERENSLRHSALL